MAAACKTILGLCIALSCLTMLPQQAACSAVEYPGDDSLDFAEGYQRQPAELREEEQLHSLAKRARLSPVVCGRAQVSASFKNQSKVTARLSPVVCGRAQVSASFKNQSKVTARLSPVVCGRAQVSASFKNQSKVTARLSPVVCGRAQVSASFKNQSKVTARLSPVVCGSPGVSLIQESVKSDSPTVALRMTQKVGNLGPKVQMVFNVELWPAANCADFAFAVAVAVYSLMLGAAFCCFIVPLLRFQVLAVLVQSGIAGRKGAAVFSQQVQLAKQINVRQLQINHGRQGGEQARDQFARIHKELRVQHEHRTEAELARL
uniref:Transmembrane protein n=1 Tax=Macrostomum lignano TaxID=282301 RepID=A0A1I8F1T7_9PLAT